MSSNNGKAPPHLNDITVQAVDKIGGHAAEQIEQAATDIRAEADVVARGLEDLAAAIREHTIKASEQVSTFVTKTTHTLGIVRELQAKMKATGDGSESRDSGADRQNIDRPHGEEKGESLGARHVPQRQGQSKPNGDAGASRLPTGAH